MPGERLGERGNMGKTEGEELTQTRESTESFGQRKLDLTDIPRMIKIELDTPLENIWTTMACIGWFGTYICFHIGVIGGKRSPPRPAVLKYIPIGIGFALLAHFLKYSTDNYYLLNTKKKIIYYHFRFFFFEQVTPFLEAAEISVVGVTGVLRQSKYSRWVEYRMVLVNRKGNTIDLSDLQKEVEPLNRRAEIIAGALGCDLAKCPLNSTMKVNYSKNSVKASFDPIPLDGSMSGETVGNYVLFFSLALIGLALLIMGLAIFLN